MTVERGRSWGAPGALGPGGVLVRSDAQARGVVERARRTGEPVPHLGLLGGDLCRTVGGAGDEARLHGEAAVQLPVDLGAVLLDGRLHWFVAHLVARRSWWRGPIFAAMNAQFLGAWDVAPRAHPNDGLLDTLHVTAMPLGQRLAARGRLRSGTHVPHPAVRQRRDAALQVDLGERLPVRLDGQLVGEARVLSLRVEPDALTVVV